MLVTLVCLSCAGPFEHDAQGGFRPQRCPPCRAERKRETDAAKARRWRSANPERNREQQDKSNRKRLADPQHRQWKRDNELRRTYGLTRSDVDAMLEAQDHLCAICRRAHVGPGTRLHVDHCHDSKRVRGLLCGKCNTAIGLLDDDPQRADAVAAYLRR
ncbi:MAG: endonuclease VII domain-containing protein [Chloroflexi bacterium]|nr:endonuclease VII domain-containing protein [Chloroflexota bacterium]